MLTTLRIKNFALVDDLTIELDPGYNVITGETGAGKSILIGAITLILGERADRSLIRSGTDSCLVEALFDISSLRGPLKQLLEQSGVEPCADNQLLIRRSLATSGANRQFVNGSPVSLNTLAALGESLVDIHGPHEHQSLLHPARQLTILDAFGRLEEHRKTFGALVGRRVALESERRTLIVDEKTYAQQLDLLRFQVAEISGARLKPGIDEEIEREHRRASNAAQLLQLTRAALDLLVENEMALLTQAGVLGRTLQELQRLDASAAPLLSHQENAVDVWRELQNELSRYADKIEVDPGRLAELEEALNRLTALKRKYGPSLGEVIAFGEEAGHKLQNLESRDAELARLNTELDQLDATLLSTGRELSAKRRQAIPQLSRAVTKQLTDLGFQQSHFEIMLTTDEPLLNQDAKPLQAPLQFSASGLDTAEFQFAPNPGEPAQALRAIASSGELARVMLALKTVLAAEDQVPVLVFDEVDANVGGETANAVGAKMRQIANRRQVLCITHLPQVAAPASAHYVATKTVIGNRTVSQITRLENFTERVRELARMLGGQTEAARKHAQALLKRQ